MTKVAANSDTYHDLDQVERAAEFEALAKAQLDAALTWSSEQGLAKDLHDVEQEFLSRLLRLGKTLLQCHLARRGTGKNGDEVLLDGQPLPYHGLKSKDYLSVFGRVVIERAYFWDGGKGVCPLDVELNLPKTCYSYLLQDLGGRLGTGRAYDQVTEILERLLGQSLWKQGTQKIVRQASRHVQGFYEQKPAPPPEEEGELLVATIDGKGVPMVRRRPRQKLGPERGRRKDLKKEAVVSAVYTVDRYVRTPEDVLRELDDEGYVVERAPTKRRRPKPKHKQVRATLSGKSVAFAELRRLLRQRDPDCKRELVVLTDGDPNLQKPSLTLGKAPRRVLVLDLLHVLTYLWAAASSFHEEGSKEASQWVLQKLGLLLKGKVGYLIGSLRQSVTKRRLKGKKREAVEKAINYMHRNRKFMRYDVYLAKGYPIASGVVEGACRHLVKDRMELAGMRWSKEGAEAVLELRAVHINGDWESFWRHHVNEEHARLYGDVTRRTRGNLEYWPRQCAA